MAWKKGHLPHLQGTEHQWLPTPLSLAPSLPTLSRFLVAWEPPEPGKDLKSWVDSIQGEKGVTDLISLLWMELYLCCLVKQHKCKRGVNCFHISFREQMRREMHFTDTSTGGVCLAWCNVEHLFLFPQGCWIISEHGYCRDRRRGWQCQYRERKKGSAVSCTCDTCLPSSAWLPSPHLLKSSSGTTSLLTAHSHWFMPLASGHPQHLVQHTNLSFISLCLVLQGQGMCVILVIHCLNSVLAQLTLKERMWTEAGEIGREKNIPQDGILAVKPSLNTQKKYKVPETTQTLRWLTSFYTSQRQTRIHPSG